MAYSDLQMKAFSRIAYMDLNSYYQSHKGDGPVHLGDALSPSQKSELIKMGIPEKEFSNWTLAAVHDTNADNGFYCCVIETSPGQATVAFRGSEGMESGVSNAMNDWARADIGLLKETDTAQQMEVRRFYEQNADLLKSYDSVATTGHSLGGNLAEYAAIVSPEYGLDSKITQCVSLDGPGFSDNFISKYGDQIAQMNGKMRHVRWSFVGRLLHDLPGVTYETADVHNVPGADKYNCFTRHSLDYLNVDPATGQVVPGSPDALAIGGKIVSTLIDNAPPYVAYPLKWVAQGVTIGIGLYNEGKKFFSSLKDKIFGKKSSAGGSSHSGGAGRHFGGSSGGKANIIKVSPEEIRAAITRYQAEKDRLMEAVAVCNSAAQMLARSWAGPSFIQMTAKLASAYKNLQESIQRTEDAIDELKKTVGIMTDAENKIKSMASSLDVGDSPFR